METCNEVRLIGRVSAEPEVRELPSGDEIVVCRVVVRRDELASPRSRQAVDVFDCIAWSGRVKRAMRAWRAGDQVQLEGAVRRRFFRVGAVTQSRVEIEILSGRRMRGSAAG